MSTNIDEQVLEELDFHETFPCEHSGHDLVHIKDEPATYYIEIAHNKCDFSMKYMICLSGFSILKSIKTIIWPRCCKTKTSADEADIKILDVLI